MIVKKKKATWGQSFSFWMSNSTPVFDAGTLDAVTRYDVK